MCCLLFVGQHCLPLAPLVRSHRLVTVRSHRLVTVRSHRLVTVRSHRLVTVRSHRLVTVRSHRLVTVRSHRLVTVRSHRLVMRASPSSTSAHLPPCWKESALPPFLYSYSIHKNPICQGLT